MSDKDFDDAFNAVVSDEETVIVDDKVDPPADAEVVDEKTPDQMEIDKLQQTVMRQAASQSALQKKLDNKAELIKPKQFAPVIDDKGVFTDSFEELKKEFPEADFGRVEDIITQQQTQISELANRFETTATNNNEMQRVQRLKEQTSIVSQTHPYLQETVQSEEFVNWQKTLTPAEMTHVKSAVNADEINNILNVFKSATGYKSKAAQEVESTEIAEATVKKREKRTQAAQGISTKQQASPATGASDKLNEDAIFDQVFSNLGIS